MSAIGLSIMKTRVLISARMKTVPWMFLPIAHLRESPKRRVIRRTTDVVIEGFWRCGNHFATYAFEVAQSKPVQIAHHFHAPAQLMLAVDWNVPAILLIREPEEAVASATVFLNSEDPLPLLKLYVIFHRAVLPLEDRVVVSDFATTTGDFGQVIDSVNQRYGRGFMLFKGCDEQMARVRQQIDAEHEKMGGDVSSRPLPSEEKVKRKVKVKDRLTEPRCQPLLDEARNLYSTLRR